MEPGSLWRKANSVTAFHRTHLKLFNFLQLSHDPRASPSNRQNNTFRELNVKPSTSQQCSILVEGLPNDATKDLVLNYFENKRRSKGGPVVDADMNSDSRTCRVIFESPDGRLECTN